MTDSEVFIDHKQAWVVPAPADLSSIGSALACLLSEQGCVALENTSFDEAVRRTLQPYLIPAALKIEAGTGWPATEWLHIRATREALRKLVTLVSTVAGPEICLHLYAYDQDTLLLEWHDAFGDPIHIAGTVPAAVVQTFCSELGVGPPKPPSHSAD